MAGIQVFSRCFLTELYYEVGHLAIFSKAARKRRKNGEKMARKLLVIFFAIFSPFSHHFLAVFSPFSRWERERKNELMIAF